MIVDRKHDWIALLQELISIPSCFEAEHAIVHRVCEHVSAIGLSPILVPMDASALRLHADAVEPISTVTGRNNVVVRLPGKGGGRSLILMCHLDICPEGDAGQWTYPPYSGEIDAQTNAIYGRGAMDNKAAVAICLGLMRVIVERQLQFDGDLLFQFVLEDEITGNGTLACLEAGHLADAAIILDGTRPDRAIDQHAGNLEFRLNVTGRPASTSVSHLGANAAELLSYMLQHLRDSFYRLNDAREAPWTEFPSPFQFIVHGMYADAPRFSLPVEARARCFLTFPPPFTIDRVRAFLVAEGRACAQARNHPHLPVFVWDGFAAEPVCCATNELRTLVRDAASRNGIPAVRVGPSTGSSDMRHFARRGIPCLLYGPGRGFNPHRPDEFFLLDDLPSMMKVYLDMIVEWSNVARGDTSSESIRNPTERVRSNGERAVLEIGVDRRTLDHERDRRAGGAVDSIIKIERRTIYEVDADQPVAYFVD
jgi:acetylornithine deacetylase